MGDKIAVFEGAQNVNFKGTINAFINHAATSRDQIIVFMGPSGAGKSNMIDLIAGTRWAANTLSSVTTRVESIRITNPWRLDQSLVLVDTPGFDNTERTDTEVLSMISDWLKRTYKKGMTVTAIVYVHSIRTTTMTGPRQGNLRVFGEISGVQGAEKVILVTSYWDRMQNVGKVAEARQAELEKTYWATMINNGATTARSDNKKDTLLDIITPHLRKLDLEEPLLLQEEMVDLGRALGETHAGRALCTNLQELLAKQKDTIASLRDEAKEKNNPALVKEFEEEYRRIQAEFDKTFKQVSALKIRWVRRARLHFAKKPEKGTLEIEE